MAVILCYSYTSANNNIKLGINFAAAAYHFMGVRWVEKSLEELVEPSRASSSLAEKRQNKREDRVVVIIQSDLTSAL